MGLNIASRIKLHDGFSMPRFGIGVYEVDSGSETYDAVSYALKHGYKLIDTAEWYGNEADCGCALNKYIQDGKVSRQDIFYTTKLMTNGSRENTVAHVRKSLKKAGLDYIDLYLLHSPLGGSEARLSAWQGACDAKDLGLVKSIGVSNFGIRHLQELFASEPKYIPVVNQIDLHPFHTRLELTEFNRQHNIVNMAYSPLARGTRFTNATIQALAIKYNKTPAQIFIRYGLEKDYVVIPKSVREDRIESNTEVFDFSLTSDEIKQLDSLNEDLVTDWEVTTVP